MTGREQASDLLNTSEDGYSSPASHLGNRPPYDDDDSSHKEAVDNNQHFGNENRGQNYYDHGGNVDADDDQELDTEAQPKKGGGPPPKYSLFSSKMAGERKWMLKFTGLTILAMCTGILALLSIYWGSYYKRSTRTGNLKALVYNLDEPSDGMDAVVGNALVKSLPSNSLGYEVRHTKKSMDEIMKEVKDEESWATLVVPQNATKSLYTAFKNADSSFNSSGIVKLVYEQERDLLTYPSVVQPQIMMAQAAFQKSCAELIYKPILKSLSQSQRDDVVNKAPNLLAVPITFEMTNLSQYTSAILLAVLQVGLIYLIIIAFFQFNFFAAMHQRMGPQLDVKSNILYRVMLSWVSYFFVSLAIGLVSLAFQVNMSTTFGKPGFLVYWMITWLAMVALGQATENVAMLLIPIYPPALSFWLLFWVISNISPAFSAMELTNNFYRYGYAFPVYNAMAALRVVLVDTTKKNMGRNIGILIAWIVVDYLVFPFCLKFFGTQMAKKAKAEKQKEQEKQASSEKSD